MTLIDMEFYGLHTKLLRDTEMTGEKNYGSTVISSVFRVSTNSYPVGCPVHMMLYLFSIIGTQNS